MNVNNLFNQPLSETDTEVNRAITAELWRQQDQINLIASENIVSRSVMQACGSIMTNKYAEGYSGKRYYCGCENVDSVENLAIERAKSLFGADYINVQPHSGSQANAAVYLALLKPGETLLGMSLDAGGHLTHGASVSSSGKYYHSVGYGLNVETGLLDYDQVASLAKEHRPKLIIAGGSAYPRIIDFKKFREIADSVGAYLMVDMAHFAGLVAGGIYPSPIGIADVVTTTTHKTLRGPRGGMILTNDPEIAKKINSAIFPGLQGGPLMHIIAGKAVAFGEALLPSYKDYIFSVVENAKVLAETLKKRGYKLVTDGTDSHLLLMDLRPQKLTGKHSCDSLALANLISNKNAVPNDPEKPTITSGLRLGTPTGTSRGFKGLEFEMVGNMIADVLDVLQEAPESAEKIEKIVKEKTIDLCHQFPIYTNPLGE